jgi:hypothetical protein
MRCAKCLSLQLDSTVEKTGTRCTLSEANHFTDHLGQHTHNGNAHVDEYICSNGHEFSGPNYRPDCPNEACQWPHVAYEMPPRAPGAPEIGWILKETFTTVICNPEGVFPPL